MAGPLEGAPCLEGAPFCRAAWETRPGLLHHAISLVRSDEYPQSPLSDTSPSFSQETVRTTAGPTRARTARFPAPISRLWSRPR